VMVAFVALTLSFPGTTFCSPARARTKKVLCRHLDTHISQNASLLSWHPCQYKLLVNAFHFDQERETSRYVTFFYVLCTAILCLATVISRRAFLLHFPLLLGGSSAVSTLHDTKRP
jgi:hypothetical protein